MALKGISLVENFTWTSPRDDAPEADKTVFTLGAIDSQVRATLQDNATAWVNSDVGMQLINRIAQRNYEVVRFGLKDIQNFKNSDGGDIKIKFVDRIMGGKQYKVVADDVLDQIDGRDIASIAEALIESNTPTDTLRKK